MFIFFVVMPGMPGSPYVLPGQTQLYPQGPPPAYDQTLTHPALVGQHVCFLIVVLLNQSQSKSISKYFTNRIS